MKAAVITRHGISNYGSLLQAMATQQVIEDMGHTCEIIDYIRDDESYMQQEKTLLRRKPEWNENPVKRMLYLAVRQPAGIAAGRYFEKARRKYLQLSKRYTAREQLVREKPEADVYITGSDQVWGPVENGSYDSTYCLSFTEETDRRIAYAASFGHTDMTPELQEYYRKWLSRYEYIAVREDSAAEILKNMGIRAVQVLDPTLLLDAAYWSRYMQPVREGKYMLIYQLHNDRKLDEYAEKAAAARNLPLIRISASLHQISRRGKFVWLPEIGQFLSYIKHAECLITDSFHGTAFAINFHTPFVEVLPDNNTGTRNMSILKMTGLTDRILTNAADTALAERDIDFTEADRILADKRKESLGILRSIIEKTW